VLGVHNRTPLSGQPDCRCRHETPSAVGFIMAQATRMKATSARPMSILIVDDELSVCKFVQRVLSEAGYVTTTAGGGPEAIEIASKLEPLDILVMMPQMSGDELARRLRLTRPSLKILYLTGFSDRLFKDRVTLWQDEAFLDKPCSMKGLLEAVSLLLFGRVETPPKFQR
jgi:two-component system cell cycle sensor histidine kinase/response regulator CckA